MRFIPMSNSRVLTIFSVLGPPIAAAIMYYPIFWMMSRPDLNVFERQVFRLTIFLSVSYFSYVFGLVPAFLSGLLLSALFTRVKSARLPKKHLVVVAGTILGYVVTMVYKSVVFGGHDLGAGQSMEIAGALSSMVCSFLIPLKWLVPDTL